MMAAPRLLLSSLLFSCLLLGVFCSNTPIQNRLSFIPNGMCVSFTTPLPLSPSVPTLRYGLDPNQLSYTATGNTTTYGTDYFHSILIEGLDYSTTYYYLIAGQSSVYSFTTALEPGDDTPFSIVVVGDMGLKNSENTMQQMKVEMNHTNWVLHIGDLSYADDFFRRPGDTYEGSWVEWQTLMTPLTASQAYMTLPGNHENTCTEVTPFLCPDVQKNFTAYNHRVRMPSAESGGALNMWYSFDYGNVHFIQISTETDFPSAPMGPGTYWSAGPFGDQITWLENDLQKAAANRQNVPWIVVSGHRPFYSSDKKCKECRAAFEPLFLEYEIDIYFSGHVHWLERLWPVVNDTITQKNYLNPQGPVYLVSGAGGNVEGLSHTDSPKEYSAYIDQTMFGYGVFTCHNSSALQFEFKDAATGNVIDEIYIINNLGKRK